MVFIFAFRKGHSVKNKFVVRQGDICLIRTDNVPANLVRKPTEDSAVTVGFGEVTGHHHTIQDAVWYVAPETTVEDLHQFALGNGTVPVFVALDEASVLTHQEHAPISLDAGVWRVLRQREYTPERVLSVRD